MEKSFSHEQRLLHQLVLHSNDVQAPGLFDGQMGIVLVLSEYVRLRKLRPLKTAINFLLEQIIDHLSTEMSLDFANGLTGIGWGIEYLLQNKFQSGCGAIICADIDRKLMQYNILRQTDLSLDKGIEGWLHYIIAHLQGARRYGYQVFDAEYLHDCHTICFHLLKQEIAPSLQLLCNAYLACEQYKPINYEMNLSIFVNNRIRRNSQLLGFHNGLAGLLYSKFHNMHS